MQGSKEVRGQTHRRLLVLALHGSPIPAAFWPATLPLVSRFPAVTYRHQKQRFEPNMHACRQAHILLLSDAEHPEKCLA